MIDWEDLWQTHCPYYKDGIATIPLTPDTSFKMKAGPGFGDCSHETTNLMLHCLSPLVKGRTIVDIGTGTGVLALAAASLGAKKVYSFEIDPDATLHARKNIALNQFQKKILLNTEPDGPFELILINMITSEQEIAWQSYPFLDESNADILTSGLLQHEKQYYLDRFPSYQQVSEQSKGEWLALHLTSPQPNF